MALPVRTNLDLLWLETYNFRAQNLSADPSGSGAGGFYFNTADGHMRQFDGATFKVLPYVASVAPVTLTVAMASAIGISLDAARADHQHAMPGLATGAASGFMSNADKAKLDAATNLNTISTLMWRDAAGRSQVNDPVAAQDIATKAYVDAAINGFDPKGSVKARSTATVTISNPGTAIFDGATLVAGDRLLLMNQTAAAENGIYVFNGASSPLTRSSDFDAWTEVPSAFVLVEQGTTYADTAWLCTADQGGTLGTTAINWIAFGNITTYTAANDTAISGVGVYHSTVGAQFRFRAIKAGSTKLTVTLTGSDIVLDIVEANLTLSNMGGVVPINKGGTGATTAAAARAALGVPGKYAQSFGDGAASTFTITHNLNTTDVSVECFETAGLQRKVLVDWSPAGVNAITVRALPVPTANELRVVVQG
jgi:hypothetical protein